MLKNLPWAKMWDKIPAQSKTITFVMMFVSFILLLWTKVDEKIIFPAFGVTALTLVMIVYAVCKAFLQPDAPIPSTITPAPAAIPTPPPTPMPMAAPNWDSNPSQNSTNSNQVVINNLGGNVHGVNVSPQAPGTSARKSSRFLPAFPAGSRTYSEEDMRRLFSRFHSITHKCRDICHVLRGLGSKDSGINFRSEIQPVANELAHVLRELLGKELTVTILTKDGEVDGVSTTRVLVRDAQSETEGKHTKDDLEHFPCDERNSALHCFVDPAQEINFRSRCKYVADTVAEADHATHPYRNSWTMWRKFVGTTIVAPIQVLDSAKDPVTKRVLKGRQFAGFIVVDGREAHAFREEDLTFLLGAVADALYWPLWMQSDSYKKWLYDTTKKSNQRNGSKRNAK